MNRSATAVGMGLFVAGLIAGCSSDEDGGVRFPLGEAESTRIQIEGDRLARARRVPGASPIEPCHLQTDSGDDQADGVCVTPLNVMGHLYQVRVANQGMVVPRRLFGEGAGLGRNGDIEGFPFNFAEPQPIAGTSTLFEAAPNQEWNRLALVVPYLDVQFEMKGEFWTVRFGFISQPWNDDPAVEECGLDPEYLAAMEINSTFEDSQGDPFSFVRGDVLLCRKATADEDCLSGDFDWLDTASDSFVAARPAQPLQHAWADLGPDDCSAGRDGEHPDLNVGGFDLYAEVDTIQLSSEFVECSQSYTYVDADGDTQTGNILEANLAFDVTDLVFVEDIADVEMATAEAIFANLTLSQIWLRSRLEFPDAPGDQAVLDADLDISLSTEESVCPGAEEAPAEFVAPCAPDGEVRTECEHRPCEPDWELVDGAETDNDGHITAGSIWSRRSSDGCEEFCTQQSCDDYQGAWKSIYCIPACE